MHNIPVIKVWCLPARLSQKKLLELHNELVMAATQVEGLGVRGEEDMVNLFPSDRMTYGLGSEIVVEVTGLFDFSKLDGRVAVSLTLYLGRAVKSLFPKAGVICYLPADPVINYNSAEDPFFTKK